MTAHVRNEPSIRDTAPPARTFWKYHVPPLRRGADEHSHCRAGGGEEGELDTYEEETNDAGKSQDLHTTGCDSNEGFATAPPPAKREVHVRGGHRLERRGAPRRPSRRRRQSADAATSRSSAGCGSRSSSASSSSYSSPSSSSSAPVIRGNLLPLAKAYTNNMGS